VIELVPEMVVESAASNHNEQPLKEVGVNPGYGTLVINLDISSRNTHYKTEP
jgi:hypothetical protein